jgi:preprotein translocase subunit Sec61beta
MARSKKESAGGALPPTGAGLIRYFDEDTQGIKMGPKTVVIGSIVFIVAFVVLHAVGL